ncbi:MAG: hypothetical protein NC254_09240 [bacterium]|nr:hypothetical protein [bacterium]
MAQKCYNNPEVLNSPSENAAKTGILRRDDGGYYGVRKYALRTGKQTAFVCGSRQPDKYKEYGQYEPQNTEWESEYGGFVKASDKR